MTVNWTDVLGQSCVSRCDHLTAASRVRRNTAGSATTDRRLIVLLPQWKATIKLFFSKMLSHPQSLSCAVSLPGFFMVIWPFLKLFSVLDWGGWCWWWWVWWVSLSLPLAVCGGWDNPKGFLTDPSVKSRSETCENCSLHSSTRTECRCPLLSFFDLFHSPSSLLTSSFFIIAPLPPPVHPPIHTHPAHFSPSPS